MITAQIHILEDLDRLGIEILYSQGNVQLSNIIIQPSLVDEIKSKQKKKDSQLQDMIEGVKAKPEFIIHKDEPLRFNNRFRVPNIP